MENVLIGQKGEDLAVQYLRKKNYNILLRNYRSPFGEIDIIGWDDDTLCFIEVRSRHSDWHGHPFESISKSKKRKILLTAKHYISKMDISDTACRFDVVSILPDDSGQYAIDMIQDAFETSEC